MTPQEVERYVLLASDASNLEHQQQANALLNQWVLSSSTTSSTSTTTTTSSSSSDALALTLIEVLRTTRREVVLFFALTAFLTNIRQTKPEHRAALRRELLSQLVVVVVQKNADYCCSCWNPTFLRTKAGVLLARLIQLDFPHHWPNAFVEMQSPELLQRAPDIYFRTLIALMDDFGKDETEVNTRLKDWLRGYSFLVGDTINTNNNNNINNNNHGPHNPATSPKQSISGQLLQTTVALLVQGIGNNDDDICLLALTAIKGFMSWMDLSLLLEEQVLQCVFTVLARGSTTDSSTADAGMVAVECLQELVARGMEEDKKLSILVHTGVFEKIYAHVNLETVDASPIDVVLEVAKFINMIGLEMIVTFGNNNNNGSQDDAKKRIQSQLLDLFFRCFAYDDIDVSGAVIPLAGSLVSQGQGQQQDAVLIISQLLTVTYRQMRYPPDFQFDYEDEDEAEEEMYRTELRKLHQKLIRAAPDACLQFTCQTMSQLPSPLSTAPTPDMEAALRLVYHYCEGIRPAPGMKVVMKNETFRNLLIAIHTSDICSHPHREVLTLYYEMTVRYYPLLKDRTDLLQKTLGSLTGTQGLQHGHPRVRSRCCYLLLRLVKSVGSSNAKNNNNNVLRPYVDTAVAGIQSLIERNSVQLRTDDVLNMFETIGLLVGKTGLEPDEQRRYLTQVITPHVRSIERILEQKQAISLDPDTYGELLSSSIAAIAFLSKGFKEPADEVKLVLLETMKINLAVLEAMPDHSQVRNKCLVLLQRSIQLLEDKALPSMPQILYLLVGHCDVNDILDVAQLFNQLCIKFQADAIPAMDAALLPFLRKCHALVSAITAAAASEPNNATTTATTIAPHLRTEQLSVQKLIFVVLQHMVTHKATAILLTPTNASSLESILQSMGEGAIHVEEALMKKTCLIFFKELIDQWCVVGETSPGSTTNLVTAPNNNGNGINHKPGNGAAMPPPPYVVQGYVRYLLDVLIPGVIESFCHDNFQIEDANHWRSLSEFACVLEILQQRLGDVYQQQVLINTLTNRLGCPAPIVEGFRASSSRKDIEASLKNLIQESRKRNAR